MMFTETRKIKLRDGRELEVQMTEAFKSKVRLQFGLQSSQAIDDDHVRMFFFGAVKTAVDKEEAKGVQGSAR